MITITKECLLKIQQWRETYGPSSNVVLPAEEAEELARIALASLEAEPVSVFKIDHESSLIKHVKKVVSETNAPPAPVSVPDFSALDRLAGEMLTHAMNCERRVSVAYTHCAHRLAEEVRDLRDAMLQGADGNSPVVPDGWVMVPFEPTAEMISSGIAAHYERSKIQIHDRPAPGPMECAYVAMIAAAPQQDTSRELFVSVEGDSCGKHPDTQLINHPHRQTASIPPRPVKYCPKCEPGVLPLKAFRIPDEWIFGAHTNCLTISCSVKSDKKITFVNSSFVNCSEPEGDIQFINCTLPAEWEGKVNAIDCVFKAAPQQEVNP